MGGFVIVSEIGSQITFIGDNLPIIKIDLLLKKPIPIFYVIVIWLEKRDWFTSLCLATLVLIS